MRKAPGIMQMRQTTQMQIDEDASIRNCSAHNQRELLSGDRGAFQNGSARTRSDADAAHMRKAPGIMQMRQTRQMQIDEDACIRN